MHRSPTRRPVVSHGTRFRLVGFLTALLCLATGQDPAFARSEPASDPERAVIRILTYSQSTSAYRPWSSSRPTSSTGTGFVIRDGAIMTNAHVVSDARSLFIYLKGDPTPHEARVRSIGHDCDLALIEPVDPTVLDGIAPLEIGTMPAIGTSVDAVGYPAGGDQISTTRGVVSRIEMHQYVHSGIDYHLAVQTDAAINPGNSGGPVLQGERVVGVSFQASAALENVGYFIPTEVVRHFLDDLEDGRYDGFPSLGVYTATLENEAARRRAGMRTDETGVEVIAVVPESTASDALEAGDVILEVEGHAIGNDATYAEKDLRFHFGILWDRMQIGEPCQLRILRDGERLGVQVTLAAAEDADRYANRYDDLPRYFVYAGLVFVPLDREMMKTFGNAWDHRADKTLLHAYFERTLTDPDWATREPVVLLRRLDHPVNASMSWHKNLVVESINGRTIRALEDVVDAFAAGRDEFHFIEFAYHGRFGVLEREGAAKAHEEILERYAVPSDRRLR